MAHVPLRHGETSAESLSARVAAYIERYQLLPESGEVLVAVSGGADSLCLLHLLHSLCGEGRHFPGVRLQAAHLNHRLRGAQSEQDAARVGAIATAWGIPITIGTIDVAAVAHREKRSLEEAARLARYRFLREVAQGRLIAVAHQADDQVETILLHWLRGSGLAGLTGMAPRQQDLIRPLLEISRAEILAYCRLHGLTPLEDESNSDPRFLRNRLRHELLPLLEELNPGIRETLRRCAEVLRVDLAWLEAGVAEHWPQVVAAEEEQLIRLRRSALLRLPLSLQRHLLRQATARLCNGQSPLEPRHYLLIERLLGDDAARPATERGLDLPAALRLVLDGDDLLLTKKARPTPAARSDAAAGEQVLHLPIPGSGAVPGTPWYAHAAPLSAESEQAVLAALQCADWPRVWRLLPRTRYVVYIDGDAAGSSLQVRTRRPGDRIQPLGMQQTKKVQDVLVDQHVPRAERATVPLFFAGTRCIWVAGLCLAESVRLGPATRRIVKLWITR